VSQPPFTFNCSQSSSAARLCGPVSSLEPSNLSSFVLAEGLKGPGYKLVSLIFASRQPFPHFLLFAGDARNGSVAPFRPSLLTRQRVGG
jgi:hypothetical protein